MNKERLRVGAVERKWLLLVLVGLVAYLVAVGTAIALVDDREAAGHAFGHLIPGTFVGFLGVATGWFWRPHPSRLWRLSRVSMFVALALFGGGQLIESLGAFAWRGELVVSNLLRLLHTVGGLATAGGFVVLGVAIPAVVLSLGLRVRNPAARLLTLTTAVAVLVLLLAYSTLVILGVGS